MNGKVDAYIQGSQQWRAEMAELRPILLGCGLTEELKWAKPCYGIDGKNVAIMQEMKGFLALMFFKGALIDDPEGLLESQGPNSRSALRMCFTSPEDVARHADAVRRFVQAAIDVERAGLTVEPRPALELVAELQHRIDTDVPFRIAFEALTPGRQREYHLHISDAKQAKTREERVERCAPRILAGKGLRDR